MKLDIEQYDFPFSKSESWNEFATKWNNVSFENEAIGLLYMTTEAISEKAGGTQELETSIIAFLIFYSDSKNKVVATKAQQLLFGKILPNWNYHRSPGSEWIHSNLMELIVEPTAALVKAPFHDFGAKYLFLFQDLVEGGNFYSKDRSIYETTCVKEVQSLFPMYVEAMINWQLAEELINTRVNAKHPRTKEIQGILENYYESQNVKFSYLYSCMSHPDRRYTPFEKRNGFPKQHDVNESVFLALMGYRFLINKEPVVPPKPVKKGLFD